MENIIVIIIVALAAAFLGRSYYKKYKKGNQGSCGCSSCPSGSSCCQLTEDKAKQICEINKPAED
jgi:hypothetical protein